jgi:BirA family biotin operon repressor/biotin-[acetyl-CoA-carboxylase] ligase
MPLQAELVARTGSTNTDLLARARAGHWQPCLRVAYHQDAGRGRRQRQWVSAPGQHLTLSLGLPLQPVSWSGLSLVVGVALAEQLPEAVQVKWPNDLWVNDAKLGGVLIESVQRGEHAYCVVGIGLNGAAPPAAVGQTATCLHALAPEVATPDWLARLVPAVLAALLDFARDGFAPWAGRFAARDALRGRQVWLSDGRQGQALGVTHQGALQLRTAAGVQPIVTEEVSVRPC